MKKTLRYQIVTAKKYGEKHGKRINTYTKYDI